MEPDDVTKLCSITNRTPVLPIGWRLKEGIASSSTSAAAVEVAPAGLGARLGAIISFANDDVADFAFATGGSAAAAS